MTTEAIFKALVSAAAVLIAAMAVLTLVKIRRMDRHIAELRRGLYPLERPHRAITVLGMVVVGLLGGIAVVVLVSSLSLLLAVL
jgi:MFS superfamily sulfate permease-like transporter